MNWLFLRGVWDERSQVSIIDDDDMWMQLFRSMAKDNTFKIYFLNGPNGWGELPTWEPDVVFSRGGFQWQADIMRRYPGAYKVYYGAGRRYMPHLDDPVCDLVIVDSEAQKNNTLNVWNTKCVVWTKPAARHFMPIDVQKQYDVCYIANGQQALIKGIQWVYNTVPSELTVLHLGYPSSLTPPDNVTCKRVKRIDMPREISRCRMGILPYWECVDSAPRALPEMMACGLWVLSAEGIPWGGGTKTETRGDFWTRVYDILNDKNPLSLPPSVDNVARWLRRVICG